MQTVLAIYLSCTPIWFPAFASLRTSDHPSPLTLLRTDRSGENRATLPPCLSKSYAYFRLSHSNMLHLHRSELDQRRLLLDVVVIADEADAQLMESVRSLTWKS